MSRSTKRIAAMGIGLVVLVALLRVGWAASAPGVPATCAHVLELAGLAGEASGEADLARCEIVMQERREQAGFWGWAKLSRCIARAEAIEHAGRCRIPR